jgi:hypothetical protein
MSNAHLRCARAASARRTGRYAEGRCVKGGCAEGPLRRRAATPKGRYAEGGACLMAREGGRGICPGSFCCPTVIVGRTSRRCSNPLVRQCQ